MEVGSFTRIKLCAHIGCLTYAKSVFVIQSNHICTTLIEVPVCVFPQIQGGVQERCVFRQCLGQRFAGRCNDHGRAVLIGMRNTFFTSGYLPPHNIDSHLFLLVGRA